jgi:Leucine-rich repeat (LRR) protein
LFQLVSTVTPLEQLEDNTTAQYAALQWLETVDTRRTLTEPQVLQRYALAVLDFSLHTSGGQSSQATSTAVNGLFSECSWTGVGCNADLQVTSLNWANSGLNGQMPAELGVLRNLTHLDLGENQIGGPLPDALYDLTELESLYLHQNKLTGIISDRIENLYGLVNLYLSNNQLSGEFPVNLGSLRGGRGNRRLRKYNTALPVLFGAGEHAVSDWTSMNLTCLVVIFYMWRRHFDSSQE